MLPLRSPPCRDDLNDGQLHVFDQIVTPVARGNQVLLCVQGGAGTGKWFTGQAVGLELNKECSGNAVRVNSGANAEDVCAHLLPHAKLLFIDNVLDTDLELIVALDTHLRKAFIHDRLFGGLSIMLLSDFLQLPPVWTQPVASPSSSHVRSLFSNLFSNFQHASVYVQLRHSA